jgi:uncharacterized protein (DUF924 family)
MGPDSVLEYWFETLGQDHWYTASAQTDADIVARFADLHRAAAACELFAWRETAEGCLAEIIVLDQFSRNMFRGQAAAVATDPLALALAQSAVARGLDLQLPPDRRTFLYMPYMHSESRVIHAEALRLFAAPGLVDNFAFERKHFAIIDRFGRYPHRNAALGRESTPAETAFLAEPGSAL